MRFTLTFLILVMALVYALSAWAQQKPFTEEQVSNMVRDGFGDESGAKLIEQRGIEFAPAGDFLQTLKAAGASEAFLMALRAAKPTEAANAKKPLNQVQIFALLAGGVPSTRVAILVQERGINFDPTADYLQMVRQTGGEDELISALKSAKVAPSKIPTTDQTGPSLEATFDFMSHMIEPEKRSILLGGLGGLDIQPGACSTFIIFNQVVMDASPVGRTQEHGYPEQTWEIFSDTDKPAKDLPRYMRFDLGGIDPSSIRSMKGCCDAEALNQFWHQHPNCDTTHECRVLESQFIRSGLHDLTTVFFKTADLKPAIERGGFETQPTCHDREKRGTECALKPVPNTTVSGAMIFFRDKERAERFVTAFSHAVKLCGGTPSMFPPTEPKK